MPNEDFKDNLAEDHRSDILKELDTYNTAPEFGMMGILQEQMQNDASTVQTEIPEKQAGRELPVAKDSAKTEPDYEKIYAPLNTSIQELGYRFDARVGDLERRIDQRAEVAQQPQAQQAQYDPDQPVTMQQYMAMQQALTQMNTQVHQADLRSEWNRAHREYDRFKATHPDFAVTPQDIDNSFSRVIGNDLNKARGSNWTGHFAQIYEQTAQPRMKSRIAELEKEVEDLRKKSTRSETPPQPISAAAPPRTATPRAAVQSPTNYRDDGLDIVNLPSFKKGKTFKAYANDIKRHYGIRNNA